MKWLGIKYDEWIHVVPDNDAIEHSVCELFCQCNPVIDPIDGYVFHEALDGRGQLPIDEVRSVLDGFS